MVISETFASNTTHFENARRAQSETPFTHQNQVVELQRAAITSQQKAQVVPETKNNTSSTSFKAKSDKEEVVSYSRKGIEISNQSNAKGFNFDSTV
ncbi:MAG: hypothetical protein O9264_09420 [Leptospira sp.]|nr:hypothetical protein [Leptospira sp.]